MMEKKQQQQQPLELYYILKAEFAVWIFLCVCVCIEDEEKCNENNYKQQIIQQNDYKWVPFFSLSVS